MGLTEKQMVELIENPKFQGKLETIVEEYSKPLIQSQENFSIPMQNVQLIRPLEGGLYKGPEPIEKQVLTLAEIFKLNPEPTLKYTREVLPTLSLPQNKVEGWFAILSVDALAKRYFRTITDPNLKYWNAIKCSLSYFQELIPKFENYRKEISPEHLKRSDRTNWALKIISEIQNGLEINVIPAQTGFLYQKSTGREFRKSLVNKKDEFGLGVLEVLLIILANPLISERKLNIDCSGDQFSPAVIWTWELYQLAFEFFDGIKLRAHDSDDDNGDSNEYGSASGFLPTGVEL
ncbi:MAG: hypothetical protein WC499_04225 [Patescibacteria group bacterium]